MKTMFRITDYKLKSAQKYHGDFYTVTIKELKRMPEIYINQMIYIEELGKRFFLTPFEVDLYKNRKSKIWIRKNKELK